MKNIHVEIDNKIRDQIWFDICNHTNLVSLIFQGMEIPKSIYDAITENLPAKSIYDDITDNLSNGKFKTTL